eukprot:jgi/Tetstr1/445630/TSEL_003435.t1
MCSLAASAARASSGSAPTRRHMPRSLPLSEHAVSRRPEAATAPVCPGRFRGPGTIRASSAALTDCNISGSAAGGLLVCHYAAVSAERLRVSYNDFNGVEVRKHGKLQLTGS